MRTWLAVPILAISLALLSSCTKTDTTAQAGPHATVALRDGTAFSGAVVKSSPTEITVAGDDKTTRTFQMKDVKSIDYGEAPTAAAVPEPSAPAPAPAPAQAPAAAARRASSAPAAQAMPAEAVHPSESAITTKTYDLAAGTQVSVRTNENIDSGKATSGQTYAAEVSKDVLDASGAVVIPRGSNARIVIRSASKGGRITGSPDLSLDLLDVSVDGRRYELDTADVRQTGRQGVGKNKRTAEFVGGGAAIGAIIGAIAGQGKGAAIGAASGAVAGGATQVLTRGGAIKVPAETVLTFRLDKPLRVYPSQ
ncbi:MAG: YMGG-like glycine zipper-containing protein [Acidobacteriota bacterium]